MSRDPHSGPVPESAWHADGIARRRGRVEMFNATRPGGLDGWTMDLDQYELLRAHILDMIDDHADADGSAPSATSSPPRRTATGPTRCSPAAARNYRTYTKVDLEARDEIERAPAPSLSASAASPEPGQDRGGTADHRDDRAQPRRLDGELRDAAAR